MYTVLTNNDSLSASIESLIQIVVDSGGYIHPSISVREVGGDFTVFSNRKLPEGKPILQVPYQCMPYLEQFDINYTSGVISYTSCASIPQGVPEPTEVQLGTMEAMMNIYNNSSKVPTYSGISPMIFYGQDEEFLKLVSDREPEFTDTFTSKDKNGEAELYCYLESRVFKDESNGGRWLLPIIDFVDHHSFADAFRSAQSSAEVSCLNLNYTEAGIGKKCFASYALMDAFHSWIKYGFVDQSAFFVQSVPFTVDLSSGVTLRVNSLPVNSGQLNPSAWKAKNQNSYFYAAQFDQRDGVFEISFLLIPPERHIEALDEVIELYLKNMEHASSFKAGEINNLGNMAKVKQELFLANWHFYKALHGCINRLSKKNEFSYEMANEMLKKQMKIVKDFKSHS